MRLAAVASSDWRSLHAGLHGAEIGEILAGRGHSWASPSRSAMRWRRRAWLSEAEHESFFRDMLADISEPVLPFGLSDVRRRAAIACYQALSSALNLRLRRQGGGWASPQPVPPGTGAGAGERQRARLGRVRHRIAGASAGRRRRGTGIGIVYQHVAAASGHRSARRGDGGKRGARAAERAAGA
ncbi:hypothetical protein M8494_28985 [Serratia ureilytica]